MLLNQTLKIKNTETLPGFCALEIEERPVKESDDVLVTFLIGAIMSKSQVSS
jgi:hypothetical protein